MIKFGGIWLVVAMVACATTAQAKTPDELLAKQRASEFWAGIKDSGQRGPVDYGSGPGKPLEPPAVAPNALAPGAATAVPPGRSDSGTKGFFARPIQWPLIPLHAVLLANGRVLSYGTDSQGNQGGFIYDVWDPTTGAHDALNHRTPTDIFCSAQSVISGSGEVLIAGGDVTINGQRNFSNQRTAIYDPRSDSIRLDDLMQFPRWYPSLVSLPNGDKLVLGGRQDFDHPTPTPEVFHQSPQGVTSWRTLSSATSDAAYGFDWGNWYYPKAFTAPNGKVLVLGNGGDLFYLNTAGNGTLSGLPQKAPFGDPFFPSLMYAPGKILSLRRNQTVALINLIGAQPTVSTTQNIDQVRVWGNATVMADGRVLVTGGSAVENAQPGARTAQIWTPTTGQWTTGARAAKDRLYHSTSLLLPDGSVLTAGGGAPGPVTNLNAEIYYPPYLFKTDSSGQPAARPKIAGAPAAVNVGQQFGVTIAGTDTITRVTLVRTGSVTHAFNPDQRYMGLSFTQNGQALSIKLPASRNNLLPGYYLLFVFKGKVPSVARVVQVI